MVKNYFYLIAGLLCIVFAVTHTVNGTSTVLPVLGQVGMEDGETTKRLIENVFCRFCKTVC